VTCLSTTVVLFTTANTVPQIKQVQNSIKLREMVILLWIFIIDM